MTDYVGGLRYRLIHDSLYLMLYDSLDSLGWFTTVPGRLPVRMIPEPVDLNQEITFNTIALADGDISDDDDEMGSNQGEMKWTYWLDFFAKDKPTGIHLANDVRDILKGRMPAIGRTHANLSVLDLSLATPVHIFYCDIEDVVVDKAQTSQNAWLKNWYTVRFDVVDTYGN